MWTNIVLTALRKEPHLRYQSARELGEDIDRHLRGLPILARRSTWRYRTTKFVRRNKALVAGVSLLILSLLGGIVGTSWQWLRAENEAMSARFSSQQAWQNERLALQQVYRANIALAASELERGNANMARVRLDECSQEFRNWEWQYFDSRLKDEELLLLGHKNQVSQSVFVQEGKQLITGSWDGTIRVWNMADGRELGVLRDKMRAIGNVVGSADGRILASASHDEVVRIWDVQRRSVITRIPSERGYIALSPDGSLLACASLLDKRVRLWNATSGELIRELPKPPTISGRVEFNGDGTQLAYSSAGGVVLWNVVAMEEMRELAGEHSMVPFAFSPDGQRLITGSNDREFQGKLWKVSTGELIADLGKHFLEVRHASFSADGRLVATASNDTTIRVANGLTGQQVTVLHDHRGPVAWTAFSPDGTYLASCSDDQTIRLWDPRTGRPIRVLVGHAGMVYYIAFTPDSRRLASCSLDGTARIWDIDNAESGVCWGHGKTVLAATFSPDNRAILSGSLDGTVRLWNTSTAREIRQFGEVAVPTNEGLLTSQPSSNGARSLSRSRRNGTCSGGCLQSRWFMGCSCATRRKDRCVEL